MKVDVIHRHELPSWSDEQWGLKPLSFDQVVKNAKRVFRKQNPNNWDQKAIRCAAFVAEYLRLAGWVLVDSTGAEVESNGRYVRCTARRAS